MAVKILKIIQLLTKSSTTTSTSYVLPDDRRKILWEAAAYGGTVEVYFEADLKSSNASSTAYAALYTSGGSVVSGSEVSVTGTVYSRQRSGNIFAKLANATEYEIRLKSSSGSRTTTARPNARLIIVQSDAASISATQTDIDLAASSRTFGTVYTSAGPRFIWDADNWDGTQNIYFEACCRSSATSTTAYVCLYDLTASAMVSNSEVSSTGTGYVNRVRSASTITLVDGHEYEVRLKSGVNTSYIYVLSATVIVKQTATPTKGETHYIPSMEVTYTATTAYTEKYLRFYWDNDEWDVSAKTVKLQARMWISGGATATTDLYDGSSSLVEMSTTAGSPGETVTSGEATPSDNTTLSSRLKTSNSSYGNYTYMPRVIIAYSYIPTTVLTVAGGTHSHAADGNLSLTGHHIIAVNQATNNHSADNIGLIEHKTLVPAEALHTHTVDGIEFGEGVVELEIAGALHSHGADSVILVEHKELVIAGSLHDHLSENAILAENKTLAIDGSLHSHIAEAVNLLRNFVLAVNDSNHPHAADGDLGLTQRHNLEVEACEHAHSADGDLVIVVFTVLDPANAAHGHFAELIDFIQAHNLTVNQCNHNHTVDGLILVENKELEVNDSEHVLTSDLLDLIERKVLEVNGGLHNQNADALDLFQIYRIHARKAWHRHVADEIRFICFNAWGTPRLALDDDGDWFWRGRQH